MRICTVPPVTGTPPLATAPDATSGSLTETVSRTSARPLRNQTNAATPIIAIHTNAPSSASLDHDDVVDVVEADSCGGP